MENKFKGNSEEQAINSVIMVFGGSEHEWGPKPKNDYVPGKIRLRELGPRCIEPDTWTISAI